MKEVYHNLGQVSRKELRAFCGTCRLGTPLSLASIQEGIESHYPIIHQVNVNMPPSIQEGIERVHPAGIGSRV